MTDRTETSPATGGPAVAGISAERALGSLVDLAPGAAALLESYGLDYCCGGSQTLRDACAEAGVDPADVIDALGRLGVAPAPEWATMSPSQLVDHLEATHHAYLRAELPRLEALAEKVAGVHGERHPELARVRCTFGELRADLEPHLLKEERVLFPMVRELATSVASPSFHCGSIANPISVMMREHELAGSLLADLRRLTDGYAVPDDGCASYRALYDGLAALEADTHLHVHKENNALFPAVVELEARLVT